MAIVINMPAMSPTMISGKIIKWNKMIGEEIKSGEVLLEIETDKAVMEVEAIDDGIVAMQVEAGCEYNVGEQIAILKESHDEEVEIETKSSTNIQPEEIIELDRTIHYEQTVIIPNTKVDVRNQRIKASPLAKKLAAEKKIDLNHVKGSGPNGRIVKKDILNHQSDIIKIDDQFEIIKLSSIQKISATRLCESKSTIPHFYIEQRMNIEKLMNVRNELRHLNISLNSIILKIISNATENQIVNSHYHEGNIKKFKNVNIGFAVSTEYGIFVPVIENSNIKSLRTLSNEANEMIENTKQKKINSKSRGTITVSNLGMTGIVSFNAIINPPETTILAIGGNIDNYMYITGSFDHRVIDGMDAALFMKRIKEYIENPIVSLI